MPEATHGKPMSPDSVTKPIAEFFAHSADSWFTAQAGLLADVDALTHAWLHPRREGVEAMRKALQRMTEAQDPAPILRLLQEWTSCSFRRAPDDIETLNSAAASL